MPSINKDSRGKSRYWYCTITLKGGKQIRKSTKLTDYDEAMAYALELERANNDSKDLILTETTARSYLNKMLDLAGVGRIKSPAASEYLQKDWLKKISANTSYATYMRYRSVIDQFIEHLGGKAALPLMTVTPRQIEEFKQSMIDNNRSPGTVNVAIKTLRIAFGRAIKDGLLLTNPATAVDTLRRSLSTANTRDIFTPEQIASLLENADKEWRGMILLGAYCGMRIKDAARLRWQNVDLKNGVIRYVQEKMQRQMEVPMSPQLWEYFSHLKKRLPTMPIFPSLYNKGTGGAHGLSELFAGLMATTGIDRVKKKSVGCYNFYGLSFHSLRHTCVSMMANSGVPEEIRRKLVGHTSIVHLQYTHFDLNAMRDAMSKMPDLKVAAEA